MNDLIYRIVSIYRPDIVYETFFYISSSWYIKQILSIIYLQK